MEESETDGPKPVVAGAHAEAGPARRSYFARSFTLLTPVAVVDDVFVLPLSRRLRILLPPLLISSLPRRAIGFSFPRGVEGKVLGVSLVVATAALGSLLYSASGVYAAAGIVWLMGGTGVLVLYNSTRHGLAFVKQMCSTCRLRPIIEEHELMHLNGESSEEVVWREARKKYTYDGLGLGTDPKIHGFCPIAKKLKESP